MYTSFFNLKSHPFQLTPDPEFLFLSRVHGKARMYLNYGVTSNSGGFILITGEVGTGKTTIIRSLINGLKKEVTFSHIKNTRVTSEQLIAMINEDFGIDINNRSKTQMLRDLTDFLIEQYGKDRKSILIIDEAQNLSTDLLEEIRLLSNLETDKSKLLQIILVGQPELRKTLAQSELRALRQRITVSCHISPLTGKETEKYIFHRLEIAGNREAVNFQDGSIDMVHNFSRGIPRLINIACDYLLLTAFVEQTREISSDMVKEIMDELEKENKYWQDDIPENNLNAVKTPEKISERAWSPDATYLKEDFNNYVEKGRVSENISETDKLSDPAIDELKANINRFYTELINRNSKNMDAKLRDIANGIKEIKSHVMNGLNHITTEIKEKDKRK